MSVNIGFDTESQYIINGTNMKKKVLSLQMSIAVCEILIIYFSLINPRFQDATADCHIGKSDVSVFRRSKYDIDLLRKLVEIQGGCITTDNAVFKAENDKNYNYSINADFPFKIKDP